MGELFENFKDIDLPAARRKAQKKGRKAGLKEGIKEGLQKGKQEGEELLLIKMICKKLAKDKDTIQIAEELEAEKVRVEKICQIAKNFAPEYDPEQIRNAMNHPNA